MTDEILSYQEAITPGKLNSGQALNYGFGWELFRTKETPFMRIPAHRFAVIALSNSNQFDQLNVTQEIARIYLGEYFGGIPTQKRGQADWGAANVDPIIALRHE